MIFDFKLSWIPDLPDFRDMIFEGKTDLAALPPLVDLRPNDVPVDPLPLLKRPAENSSAPANTQKQSRR